MDFIGKQNIRHKGTLGDKIVVVKTVYFNMLRKIKVNIT